MKSHVLSNLKLVYKKPSYIIGAIIVTLFFYLINVLILNFQSLVSFYNATSFIQALSFFLNLTLSFHQSIMLSSYIFLVILSILTGILLPLLYFKTIYFQPTKSSFLGLIGVLFATLIPGCITCGIGLIGLLGLSGVVISVLPYEGLEISILATFILLISIYFVSKNLLVCKTRV